MDADQRDAPGKLLTDMKDWLQEGVKEEGPKEK